MVYDTSDFSAIWKWHLQNTKMSKSTSILVQTSNGGKVWSIVYHWLGYVRLNHDHIWFWHFGQNQIGCWLRPKYLGQRYTIPQTFRRFGNDIFKIPKCQNQLGFWFKLAPSAWKHVPPCDTWFHAPGKSFMPYGRGPEGLSVPGYTKTAISTLFWTQTCADRLESCITWWYMIPSVGDLANGLWKVSRWF